MQTARTLPEWHCYMAAPEKSAYTFSGDEQIGPKEYAAAITADPKGKGYTTKTVQGLLAIAERRFGTTITLSAFERFKRVVHAPEAVDPYLDAPHLSLEQRQGRFQIAHTAVLKVFGLENGQTAETLNTLAAASPETATIFRLWGNAMHGLQPPMQQRLAGHAMRTLHMTKARQNASTLADYRLCAAHEARHYASLWAETLHAEAASATPEDQLRFKKWLVRSMIAVTAVDAAVDLGADYRQETARLKPTWSNRLSLGRLGFVAAGYPLAKVVRWKMSDLSETLINFKDHVRKDERSRVL